MSGSRRISSIWSDSSLLPQLPGMNAGFTLPALCNTTLPSSGVSSYVHDAIDATSAKTKHKAKINKKLRCTLIEKNIHHHAHHRNSGKMDDTDRELKKENERDKNSEAYPLLEQR